jgi:hypothetical protein
MSQQKKIYMLVGLLVFAGLVYWFENRDSGPSVSGGVVTAADLQFRPLDIQEPKLRLDQLARLRNLEYSGVHRNIFVEAPPPPPPSVAQQTAQQRMMGPMPPPPPPPLQVPAEFFGYASRPTPGKKVAFFTSGDDVLVVAEGDTFLNRFRLVHIGNDSADVEEISSGRHTMVPMVQPPPDQAQ